MADNFAGYNVGLESPLSKAEVATSLTASPQADHTFATLPRAINCSAEGTLVVDMGGATGISIHVVAGLNPYRISKVYLSGSTVMTVVGMS